MLISSSSLALLISESVGGVFCLKGKPACFWALEALIYNRCFSWHFFVSKPLNVSVRDSAVSCGVDVTPSACLCVFLRGEFPPHWLYCNTFSSKRLYNPLMHTSCWVSLSLYEFAAYLMF